MRLLLVLCLQITCSSLQPDYTGITTAPAQGSASVPCGSDPSRPAPLVLKLQMEEYSNDSWVVVGMTPIVLRLNTSAPSLLVAPNDNTASNYSCTVDTSSNTYLTSHRGNGMNTNEMIDCHCPHNWTLLRWSRGNVGIATVHRAVNQLHVLVERRDSSFSITSIIEDEAGNYSCLDEPTIKRLNATCHWSPPYNRRDWDWIPKENNWIIIVVAPSCALLCLLLVGCFLFIKRRRRARRPAHSRFFKVSTASRNLYTNSMTPETDVTNKDQDFTYQNVSLSKVTSDDHYSDKSSFLSMGGDSYLEPIAEAGDQVSDAGDCYENPSEEPDDHVDSLDGDCYENTNEEIKDGSEGSQSYEDMKGSICVHTKTEASPEEGITQDEDADSYENMQTPLYTQLNRLINPPNKSTEDLEGRKASLTDPPNHQNPWKVSTQLQEQNGDFYLSYEANNL
ncbi:B-lymphocyte antigen CD19 isoform X1 [Engystomops pustulosus]|uniref:B-lymphocyte antigen CD19 isoform X1 n=1 Tax=Engystomops pustulosus TaxID=76066 RepID=UPI003AFA3DAB